LSLDFQTNKRVIDDVAIIPSTRMRNKIAGFTTHLMRRIQTTSVKGISIKLQEEEREKRDNTVPERSALDLDVIEVDPDTVELLKEIGFSKVPRTQTVEVTLAQPTYRGRN
jgi:small subunit ribosomal protein S17e